MVWKSCRGFHGSWRDPRVSSGEEALKNSRVESGRARRRSKSRRLGRVGSGFRISWVASGRVTLIRSGPRESDSTCESSWKIAINITMEDRFVWARQTPLELHPRLRVQLLAFSVGSFLL